MNVYAKFRCASLRIKKALVIFRELITTTRTRTTRVAFWDPPSGSKQKQPVKWQDRESATRQILRASRSLITELLGIGLPLSSNLGLEYSSINHFICSMH